MKLFCKKVELDFSVNMNHLQFPEIQANFGKKLLQTAAKKLTDSSKMYGISK